MKLVLHTSKCQINLNVLIKNVSELLLFLLSIMLLVIDTFKLVVEPFITGNLTGYTEIGFITSVVAIVVAIITYDDLKQYIGG